MRELGTAGIVSTMAGSGPMPRWYMLRLLTEPFVLLSGVAMSILRSFLPSVMACAAAALVVASVGAPPAGASTSPGGRSAQVAASPGEVKTNKGCRPGRYKTRYKIRAAHEAPVVTHIRNKGIPPSGMHKVSRTAIFEEQISANAKIKYGSQLGVSGVAKVLVKAEAKLDVQLAAAGSRTTKKNVTITDWVKNPTSSNKVFVFYRGFTKASGAFRQYFCKIYYLPGQSYGPAFVTYRTGKWSSYRVMGDGALRCGAGGAGNALAAAALRVGCP